MTKLKKVVKKILVVVTIVKIPLDDWVKQVVQIGDDALSSIYMNWLFHYHFNCILPMDFIAIENLTIIYVGSPQFEHGTILKLLTSQSLK